MVTFTRVREVVAGDPILDTDLYSMTKGVNDKTRSGAGDCAFRIFYYFFKMWTQVLNPDENGAFHPQGEFLEFYMHLLRENATWPTAPPGDPEGSDVASVMMGYEFGLPQFGVQNEAGRLLAVALRLGVDTLPTTEGGYWELAKFQRGVIVPGVGGNAPAMDAAVSYWQTSNVGNEHHGRSYGGYVPTPESLGNCGDGDGLTQPTNNQKIFFTPIEKGPLTAPFKEYEGSCPPGGTFGDAPKHVNTIGRTPRAYYVRLNDGTLDVLPTKDYLEGPYKGGGVLGKRWGWHLNRVFNDFVAGFAGTPGQQAQADFDEEKFGWDVERFLKAQYFLAPNVGHDTGTEWVADYPDGEWLATDGLALPAGTLAKFDGGSDTAHGYAAGFVLGGIYASAIGLVGTVEVEVMSGDRVIHAISLTADELGHAEKLALFEVTERPNPLRFRLRTGLRFMDSAGWLSVEGSEVMEYKPDIDDLFIVTRLASSGSLPELGLGEEEPEAATLSDRWWETGAIVNPRTSSVQDTDVEANLNPVFESARAMTRESVRLMNRKALVGYEVNGEGKSVLYFKRYALGLVNTKVDLFWNLAPSNVAIPSGGILARTFYIARGAGSVTYMGNGYSDGQRFTGGSDKAFLSAGGCEVYEYEGITPPGLNSRVKPGGMSCEWVMELQSKTYSLDGGIFTPEAFSDQFPLVNRCHWMSPSIDPVFRPDVWRHFCYGKAGEGGDSMFAMAPEAPTGYNYASGTNGNVPEGQEEFYRSCRIYEPPDEVESATVLFEGGQEIVKLVFKKRFRNMGALAPLPIGRDPGSWDVEAMRAEVGTRRTPENSIREFLLHLHYGDHGYNCTKGALGDTGIGSGAFTQFDNLWGACYPHFIFVKLLEGPHLDANSDGDEADTVMSTKVMRRAEWMTRAFCEGFVDEAASVNLCGNGNSDLMDYTYENLADDANGQRWVGTLPAALRPDLPFGCGPLQRTGQYAEMWNRQARMLNLLRKVRLPLPFRLLSCVAESTNEKEDGHGWPDPTLVCPNNALLLGGSILVDAPDMGPCDAAPDEWVESNIVRVSGASGIDSTCIEGHGVPCVGAGKWRVYGTRQVAHYRLEFKDQRMVAAIPETLLDAGGNLSTDHVRFLAIFTDAASVAQAVEVFTEDEAQACNTVAESGAGVKRFWDPSQGMGYRFDDFTTGASICAVFSGKGEMDAEVPAGGDWFVCSIRTSSNECGYAIAANSNSRQKSIELSASGVPYAEVALVDLVVD